MAGAILHRFTNVLSGVGHDGGFAAVDALMALLILATSLALGLTAVEQGVKLAKRAETFEAAKMLAATLQATYPAPTPEANGVAHGFNWSVAWRQESNDVPPPRLCWQDVALVSESDARRFHFSRAMFCPDAAAGKGRA